jgi:RNA polymerase sigma-70 factor, ECF subfamily
MAREYSTAGGLRAKARTAHAKIQVFDAETEPGASSKIIGLNFSCRNLSPRHSVTLMKGHTAENSLKALKKEADERLLIEAAQQDPARFAELYEINFERVYAYVVRRVGNRTETEDLTSEVFHQALANLKRFEWRGIPFAAWLFRIAANLISDRWQRSGREVPDESGQIDAAQVSPVEIEEVERRATLFRLVDTLPNEQRRVVVLRFVEQKSIKEVAREIRKTEGAVKQLQFRALSSLRARMEGADA